MENEFLNISKYLPILYVNTLTGGRTVKWIEAENLPDACLNCKEEDCYNCDWAGERWYLSQEEKLRVQRKGLIKKIEYLQRKIQCIDAQLLQISKKEK